MAPRTRQETINFRSKKIVATDKQSVETADFKKKNVLNEDIIEETTRKTPRKIKKKLEASTPSTAFATLSIQSPNATSVKKAQVLSSIAEQFPCREEELGQLNKFIWDCIDYSNPGSLYISGYPGTGKTAALNLTLENLQVRESRIVNVAKCRTCKSLFSDH